MPARPFHPDMNRPRRQTHGAIYTAAGIAAFAAVACAGQHGAGPWLGRTVAAAMEVTVGVLARLRLVVAWELGVVLVAVAFAGLLAGVAWVIDAVLHDPLLEEDPGSWGAFGEPTDGEAIER